MKSLKSKYGSRALITGGSSGIGKAFAIELAKQGITPILVARNKEKLKETAQEILTQYNIVAQVFSVDISSEEASKDFLKEIDTKDIDIFIHSAGMENNGSFTKISEEKELQLIHINVTATYMLTNHFSKKMSAKGKGAIMLVSSMVGLMASPYFSNYAASKAYVHNLGLSLNYELKDKGVDISVLAPGLTDTSMAAGAGVNWSKIPMAQMTAERAAKISLSNLGKKATIIPGFRNKMMVAIAKRIFSMKAFGKMNGMMIKNAIEASKL